MHTGCMHNGVFPLMPKLEDVREDLRMSNPLAAPGRGADSNGEASTSSVRGPEASFHAGAYQASAPCRKYRTG